MTLPVIPLPVAKVPVGDVKMDARALSRSEALQLQTFKGDPAGAEAFIVSRSLGVDRDEAIAWLDSTPVDVVDAIVEQVLALSGLVEGAGKSDVLEV